MTEKNLVLDVHENPKSVGKWFLYAIQHLLAMLVACITVPMIINSLGTDLQLPIGATVLAAGVGTIFYILLTKFKSPVFLSSSFAYLSPMITIATTYGMAGATQSPAIGLILGTAVVGVIYCLFAILVRFTGANWINKLLPPIVVGPVIMVIGLSLAGSAVNNLTGASGAGYNLWHILVGLFAAVITAIVAHFGKKTLKTIPFIIGILAGYALAAGLTVIGQQFNHPEMIIINFEPLTSLFKEINLETFINMNIIRPESGESFLFLRDWSMWKNVDWAFVSEIAILFGTVSLVTLCEHIGDHKNLSNIIDKDLLAEPGLHRTVAGDGIATALSGSVCGAANTSYGENVGVVAVTGVASSKVVFLAAILSIIAGLISPFTAALQTIPACVCGGVSLVLYGFIANSGVKLIMKEKLDFNKNRNIFIASVILVAGIGGLTLTFGKMTITSVAVSMILGIILNLILREKKTDYYVDLPDPFPSIEDEDVKNHCIDEEFDDSELALSDDDIAKINEPFKENEPNGLADKSFKDAVVVEDEGKLVDVTDELQSSLKAEEPQKQPELTTDEKVAKKFTKEQLIFVEAALTQKMPPKNKKKVQMVATIRDAGKGAKLWKMKNSELLDIVKKLELEQPKPVTKVALITTIIVALELGED